MPRISEFSLTKNLNFRSEFTNDLYLIFWILILLISRCPADKAQARDYRLGPSRRPGLKSDPKIEPDAYKTNAFLDILLILGVPTAAAAALYFWEILSGCHFNF